MGILVHARQVGACYRSVEIFASALPPPVRAVEKYDLDFFTRTLSLLLALRSKIEFLG